MRFTGLKSLGLFLNIMEGLGFKPSLSISDIKRWFYENAYHVGLVSCDIVYIQNGMVLQFYDKGIILLEVILQNDRLCL